MILKTEAIVLKTFDFRETSRIATFFTKDYGKVKGVLKGIRKDPRKFGSHLDKFSVNDIVYYQYLRSDLHLISQCELLSPLSALQRDVETMQVAALCVDLVDAVVPLEEPQPAIYRLLKQTLERLCLGGDELLGVRVHFIVRLLRLAGFQPQLDECTGCGIAIHAAGYWSARQGGLLCERCLHEDPQAEAASPPVLEALSALSQSDQPVAMETPLLSALRERLEAFLRWRLDRPLKTLTT